MNGNKTNDWVSKMRKLLNALMIILIIFCFPAAGAEDTGVFERGIAAFGSGDYETAFLCFSELAEKGDAAAIGNLGTMYYRGLGVEQSYEKAETYYTAAADGGNQEAQFNLALMYHLGTGVEKDYGKALLYYGMAAEKNNANALNNLATMVENGLGTEPDAEKAL